MVAAFLRGMLSGELVWQGAGRAAGRGYGWLVVAGCVVIAAAGGYRESETEIVGDDGEIAVNGPWVPVPAGGVWSFEIFTKGGDSPRACPGCAGMRFRYFAENSVFESHLPTDDHHLFIFISVSYRRAILSQTCRATRHCCAVWW